jgi:ABC-type transporter Mla MlaB component
VREEEGKLTLDAAGVKAEFRGAWLKRSGQTLTINLGGVARMDRARWLPFFALQSRGTRRETE